LTSYENLYNSSNTWSDADHAGIDETFSVSKFYDSGRVIASNYQMSNIEADFSIDGDDFMVWGYVGADYNKCYWVDSSLMKNPNPGLPTPTTKHPYAMNYNRGKGSSLGGDGNWVVYDRSLYQYNPSKQWKFNKYSAAGVLANEYSASETNNTPALISYMNNDGNLLPGAYPIQYRARGNDDKNFPPYERTTILKMNYYGTDNLLDNNSAKNMIYFKREGLQYIERQYLFFKFEYANGAYYGYAQNGETTWPTTTKRNARGFGNMDLCPVNLINDYAPNTRNRGRITLIAKTTTRDGKVKYWSWNKDATPSWRDDDGTQYMTICDRYREDQTGCYEFERVLEMTRPTNEHGERVALSKDEEYGYWLELPTNYCILEIMIGVYYPSTVTCPRSIIMRNFNVEQINAADLFGEVNDAYERKDTIYSSDTVTENAFDDVTFFMCSKNKYNGLASLYYQNDETILDTCTYPIGKEKIEEHYLRLIVKLFSKYDKYNDIIYMDDLKFNYSDRWFNGGTFNLIEGTVSGCFISHNNLISGQI
jgi:hypothetical protein